MAQARVVDVGIRQGFGVRRERGVRKRQGNDDKIFYLKKRISDDILSHESGYRIMVITPVFQTGDRGSIPLTRSKVKFRTCCGNFILWQASKLLCLCGGRNAGACASSSEHGEAVPSPSPTGRARGEGDSPCPLIKDFPKM